VVVVGAACSTTPAQPAPKVGGIVSFDENATSLANGTIPKADPFFACGSTTAGFGTELLSTSPNLAHVRYEWGDVIPGQQMYEVGTAGSTVVGHGGDLPFTHPFGDDLTFDLKLDHPYAPLSQTVGTAQGADADLNSISAGSLHTEIPEGLRAQAGPIIIVNNITVSIAAFAGGMTAGLYTVFVLVLNGTELGTVFAVLQRAGVASSLVIFILAHGFLELSAIFLAGGAGLRLAWAILHPDERTRGDALRIAGAQAMRIMLLVAVTLVCAGLIEGFVSPTTLAPAGKLAIGVLTGVALWSYILLPYNQRFFSSR
jgi:uncharacterized membrane protein SpoIIM required for sporulation